MSVTICREVSLYVVDCYASLRKRTKVRVISITTYSCHLTISSAVLTLEN
jgi:hypothetical protein